MRTPSIGLTRGLWHDRERYLESYWARLPGLWVHGDFASRDADGMWYVHGRSDDTLKIAGKRTGPSEIEALLMGTGLRNDAVTIGVPDPIKGTAVVCLCVARPDTDRDTAINVLSAAVTAGLGGAFRPADVVVVPDLPRTRTMKLMRRVVRSFGLARRGRGRPEPPGQPGSRAGDPRCAALTAIARTRSRHAPGRASLPPCGLRLQHLHGPSRQMRGQPAQGASLPVVIGRLRICRRRAALMPGDFAAA